MTPPTSSDDVARNYVQTAPWRPFRDPSVEADYRAWHREEIVPLARAVGIGSSVVWAVIPLLFAWVLGEVPGSIYISNWVIALPMLLIIVAASYTELRRWANVGIAGAVVILGLDFTWVMSDLFNTHSGAIACGVFSVIFYPLIVRLPIRETATAVTVLTAVPVGLFIRDTARGDVPLFQTWPYIAIMLATAPVLVVGSALIDAGMRRQFVAQRTIALQQEQLETSRRLLQRYAPAAVVDRIESGDHAAVGVPQRLRVTALSSDITGFTEIADRLDPESLSQIINEYVAAMSEIIESQKGVVTEFAGDGMMAIFGAPERCDPVDQVRQAMAAARSMHERLSQLTDDWYKLGIDHPLQVRIGINSGVLSVGTFGSDGRGTYTAIGLQMNIAARIQAEAEPGRTLLSGASWHLVKDEAAFEPLGEVTVKGVHFPIAVYAAMESPATSPATVSTPSVN